MIIDWNELTLYVRPGYTDLRKAVNGLSVIVQEEMEKDPFSPSLFLFRNRDGKLLKALYWDRTGFCLWLVGVIPLLAHATKGRSGWKSKSSPGLKQKRPQGKYPLTNFECCCRESISGKRTKN